MGPVSIGVEVQRNTDGDTPSTPDRDRDLACCWLKQKIVSDFPDFKGVSIPVKHARVLRWHTRHGHLQVRCLTHGL